jgi:hypothetical protein
VELAINRWGANQQLADDPDFRLLLDIANSATTGRPLVLAGQTAAAKIIKKAVDELTDGTIIADFYLPYQLGGEGGVQFVLPKPPPTFRVAVGCTNTKRQADITLTPEGGLPPYSYRVGEGKFQPLKGSFTLGEGEHAIVVQDAEGTESVPQTVTVTVPLAFGEGINFDCIGDNNEYVVTATVVGGTPPYSASRGTFTDDQYQSDTLPGNADTEVTVSDSQQCSFTYTFNHSCLPPLTFTTQVGCTSPNQVASVQITPTGGTAPYQVRVDNARQFSKLEGPLSLAVGTHTIIVRDAAGAVTEPQTVVVLPPLTLTATRFECDATGAYRATIQITGGMPPYIFNGQPLTSSELTTEPVASGKPVRVEVTDQNKCSAQLETTHTCEQPCDLPCGGESRRCAYRLWVQPPADNKVYKVYQAAESKITLRYNGKTVELPAGLVAMSNGDLNSKFHDVVADVVKRLNKAIAKEIGKGLIELSYQPDAKDPFARLWIEYFVCETFSLSFDYAVATPEPVMNMNVTYSNEPQIRNLPFNGATFINNSMNRQTTRIPAFDCTERNQCTNSPAKAVCETPEIKVEADTSKLPQITGRVGNIPATDVSAWIWDMSDALLNGAFQTGQTITINNSGEGRLTVITKTGCFGTVRFKFSYKP